MPKQLLEVTNFSGGLNCYSDARDIEDNQFIQNWNFMVDKAGILRMGGQLEYHIDTDYHTNDNFSNGQNIMDIDLIELLKKLENEGAGEIILTSINQEGSRCGYDLKLYKI